MYSRWWLRKYDVEATAEALHWILSRLRSGKWKMCRWASHFHLFYWELLVAVSSMTWSKVTTHFGLQTCPPTCSSKSKHTFSSIIIQLFKLCSYTMPILFFEVNWRWRNGCEKQIQKTQRRKECNFSHSLYIFVHVVISFQLTMVISHLQTFMVV